MQIAVKIGIRFGNQLRKPKCVSAVRRSETPGNHGCNAQRATSGESLSLRG